MSDEQPDQRPTVTFEGVEIRLSGEDVPYILLLDLSAALAGEGPDAVHEARLAQRALLETVIAAEDWQLFRQTARKARSGEDAMWAVISDALGRPTVRSSDSSDGPTSTEQRSTATPTASEMAAAAFPERPDLQIAVVRQAEAS